MNTALAQETLRSLSELGVREICVCPGSRNAPWIQLLTDQTEIRTYYFFEERSAAFFALGRIRSTGNPVAVMTTSGTAVGELLPATMEAFYSGLPLILLTADRPRRFRKTGAPQSAEQVTIFGQYARSIDLAGAERAELPKTIESPLHLNVCFEEPMKKDTAVPQDSQAPNPSFQQQVQNPFVVVGSLTADERPGVRDFLLRFGAPAYFEAQSGLRECAELERVRIHVADKIFDRAAEAGCPIDGVLRIGGIPTHRLWRDLEDRFPKMPVLSVSKLPFPGLARPTEVLSGNLEQLLRTIPTPTCQNPELRAQSFFEADRISKTKLITLLESEPRSETGIVHGLSKLIPENALVFVGNSLPIREWDLAATWNDRGFEVLATRGVNGIDGQISTFLGLTDPARACWAVFGDLTTLYDLSGPWILPQLPQTRVDIVVINNGGGKIFDRMYTQREFQNPHNVGFEGLAKLWNLHYVLAKEVSSDWSAVPADGRSRLIELVPDEAATRRFWERYFP